MSKKSDRPLDAIINFRKAMKRLEHHMGRLQFYDQHGTLIADSAAWDKDGVMLDTGNLKRVE